MQALLIIVAIALLCSTVWAAEPSDRKDWPDAVVNILEHTQPLQHPRGGRLPLLLWSAHSAVVEDDDLQREMIVELDRRGVAVIATWDPGRKEATLAAGIRIARIQHELGLEVCINANACMYSFFNGDESTAHLDEQGQAFFDPSIPNKIGCPFRIDHRYADMTERVDFFVRGYHAAGLPIDFVYGDWEIDGPLEVNKAWESSRKCKVCRKHIRDIDDFRTFAKAIRIKRSHATRSCYSEPILSRYPKALVGNYAVYPNNGSRYWFDYFETFYEGHPHRFDQRAPYRTWYDDFPLSGYTFAMPVCYTWARTFGWYDFANTDYRWFYNMLLIASNAGKHTDPAVPIIPFVHWHTVFVGGPVDENVKQMSERAYQEFLWHALLRGSDTFFMWSQAAEYGKETQLLHEVWAASLEYADWLNRGTPIWFDVPSMPGPVVSGVRVGGRVLLRRTDFDDAHTDPVTIEIDGRMVSVPRVEGACQIIELE